MEALPKNCPTRREVVQVNRLQFDHIFSDAAVAKGDEIAHDLAKLKDDIAPACDKTFVMMKNKQVWFDRNNAALYPKFDKFSLPSFTCNDGNIKKYSLDFEKFKFTSITLEECRKSFVKNIENPYQDSNGNFGKYFSSSYTNHIITENVNSNGISRYICTENNSTGSSDTSSYTMNLVPIHRLRGKNAAAMSYPEAVLAWIANGLIPKGLSNKQEKFYKTFLQDYPTIADYVTADDTNIKFDGDRFKRDVLGGKFKAKVFDYDFDIRGTLDGVMSGQKQYTGSVDSLKQELLECDHKRANIQPYDERQLTDVNRGHWELFEDAASDTVQVQLPENEMLVARPPQLDVRLNGVCAIDFGTKSTVVVCRDGEARMLRVGQGDYSKVPTMKDFENPTVIELRDIQNFLAAYRARKGRPFTEWNQVTVSHQAAEAIFKEGVGSSVYNSVFSELKQWAKDEQSSPVVLKDLSGAIQEIKPYLETKSIDEGDFDPIELYAYYLGLYINNMHRQIYLDYILSFPVNYKKDVREHIRKSFESGIRKSLPPALLADEEIMKRFRVYLGASEPAAYAISALECFGLEPKNTSKKVAYGVFDFGGGTTDFDFGIEYVPENRRRNFIIDQFGFNGDVLLGGENMLELLAYEVYKDNVDIMREKKIPFVLPAGCEIFAGAETLVSRKNDASAHMNNRILSEALRPIWENTDERKALTEKPLSLKLFSGTKSDSVNLKIDAKKLDALIEARIREGIVNFFQSMKSAFVGREVYPIHIFLAGNSCRSPLVKKIFDEFIENEDGEFVLHMPLGMDTPSVAEKLLALANEISEAVKDATAENLIALAKKFAVIADEVAKITDKPELANHARAFANRAQEAISIYEQFAKDNGKLAEESTKFFEDAKAFSEEIKRSVTSNQSAPISANLMELDKQRTGKTGVAFGLLRCRKGGKDVKIINRNVDANDEMIFPYFLGDAGDDGKTFTVRIGREVPYGEWAYFTVADEPEFELYYTMAPRSLQGKMTTAQVSMIHCVLDEDDTSDDDDVGVYIRKVAPNQIEYAVGSEEDFSGEFGGKIYKAAI